MTEAEKGGPPQRDGTVSRVLRLVTVLGEAEGPLSANQIAVRSGLPISTVHRLIRLLTEDGFATHRVTERTYEAGLALHRLSGLLSRSGPAVLAQPVLDALSARFNETAVFSGYLADRVAATTVAKSDGRRPLRYHIELGTIGGLARGASVRCFLAYLPEDIIRFVYATDDTPDGVGPLPPLERYLADLAEIRDRGFATSAGERIPGSQSVAAAVFGPGDRVAGGVCLTFPRDQPRSYSIEEAAEAVRQAAAELTVLFGGVHPARAADHRPAAP